MHSSSEMTVCRVYSVYKYLIFGIYVIHFSKVAGVHLGATGIGIQMMK
jgi:hypothetical protein